MKDLNFSVKDCYKTENPKLEIISPEAKLSNIFKSIQSHKESRTVFVVDENKTLLGLIDIQSLLKIISSQLVKHDSLANFGLVWADQAKDVMIKPTSVCPEDNVSDVLKKMVESKMEDLPVVDKENKVIGSVSCFELLDHLVD